MLPNRGRPSSLSRCRPRWLSQARIRGAPSETCRHVSTGSSSACFDGAGASMPPRTQEDAAAARHSLHDGREVHVGGPHLQPLGVEGLKRHAVNLLKRGLSSLRLRRGNRVGPWAIVSSGAAPTICAVSRRPMASHAGRKEGSHATCSAAAQSGKGLTKTVKKLRPASVSGLLSGLMSRISAW